MPTKKLRKKPDKKKAAPRRPVAKKKGKHGAQSMEPARKIKDQTLLLHFRVAMAELREADAVTTLNAAALEGETSKPMYAFLNQLRAQYNQSKADRQSRAIALQEVVVKIATKTKIPVEDMNQYTIDDQSGAVTLNEETKQAEGSGAPN